MKLPSKFLWERFATAIKIDTIPFFNAHSPPEDSLISSIDQTGPAETGPAAGPDTRIL